MVSSAITIIVPLMSVSKRRQGAASGEQDAARKRFTGMPQPNAPANCLVCSQVAIQSFSIQVEPTTGTSLYKRRHKPYTRTHTNA